MAELVSRVYSNFRGVDFRGEETALTRSPDCLNVWKDYKAINGIRTRPCMNPLYPGAVVYGIFFFGDQMFIHSGKTLQKVDGNKPVVIFSDMNEAASSSFVYENVLYIKDGKNYLQYDGITLKEVEGYVPTTTTGRSPSGSGQVYQDVNLLSNRRKNIFVADGESTEYHLDARNIDKDFVPVVTVNNAVYEDRYSVDYENGVVTFLHAPEKPHTDGQGNVVIEFSRTAGGREKIMNCTLLQVFDNRVFFSGNKDYPNKVWHCSLHDPTYVSDDDVYTEGMDEASITGLVAGNNALWVFREPSAANTTVFYHTPTLDDEYGKIYPSVHSSVAIGCVGKAINFNDDIVFFSDRGMEGISGDITTEQVAAHRSSLVDRKMLAEANYKNMILEEWEGYLLVIIRDKVYLADSRAVFANENHMEYEWFYWEMERPITCTCVKNGILYLGTQEGVYLLNGLDTALESHWVTPKDKFNRPHKQKTTNKRGCVAEATGDISVYAKLEDTDFELIGSYEGISDYFTSRIKRKKFKDIQLKFHSNTRFSLETVTIEAFVGGYIKR